MQSSILPCVVVVMVTWTAVAQWNPACPEWVGKKNGTCVTDNTTVHAGACYDPNNYGCRVQCLPPNIYDGWTCPPEAPNKCFYGTQSTPIGRQGVDWWYYQADTADWTDKFEGGKVLGWNGPGDSRSEHDMGLFSPTAMRVTLQPSASWPASKKPFYLNSDVTWVVISGSATFGSAEIGSNADAVHSHGDVFWVSAGTTYGPVVNTGSSDLVINVLTGGGRSAFVPQTSSAPRSNPSTLSNMTRLRSYREVDGTWVPNPSPHTDECTSAGGVLNMGFDQVDMSPPVLRVKWAPHCVIPFHYHPTGAIYNIQYGKFFFKGDLPSDKEFNAGDIRWVRPGYNYGPEYTTTEHMQITVLGADTPPTFAPAPSGPYLVRHSNQYLSHVYGEGKPAHMFEI